MPLGNRLVEIDPANGDVTRSVFVGSEPTMVATSATGPVAYVALAGGRSTSPA